jgi:glycosyltransferase involved in cell wall biosynthesis
LSATVTTIIPTFQRPLLLRRAIESALAQTYRDIAVRVYDNASGDETGQVVADIAARDARVAYACRSENTGAAANFNAAMKEVETPFFSFLSDDDVLLPSFYATALDWFAKQPEAAMFAGSTLEFNATGALRNVTLNSWPREGLYRPPESVLRMLDNQYPTWTSVMFRREVLEHVGTLDEQVPDAMDLDYELRVAARSPILISFQPCAAWLVHADSAYGNESAHVARSFSRIIEKFEREPQIDGHVRSEVASRLRAQVPGKLVEVSVKAQVRGDSTASREAARMLADLGHGALARSLLVMIGLCEAIAPIQGLLVWLESLRLRMRASRARRSAAKRVPDISAQIAGVRGLLERERPRHRGA